ncbi:hypothetical protein ABPG72_000172 [Tetrahymena utriculariae]
MISNYVIDIHFQDFTLQIRKFKVKMEQENNFQKHHFSKISWNKNQKFQSKTVKYEFSDKQEQGLKIILKKNHLINLLEIRHAQSSPPNIEIKQFKSIHPYFQITQKNK